MPFVRLKIAASLDGVTALPGGQSQWITSKAAREDGHRWRAQADGVLTGVGTVLADDPRLDVRTLPVPTRQPGVVVVDSRLRTPRAAALLLVDRPRLIWAASQNPMAQTALEAAGAQVFHAPAPNGRVDLRSVMAALDGFGWTRIHVEAGAALNGALLRAGLVDEVLLYLAPTFLGEGRGLAQIGPLATLTQGVAMDLVEAVPVGPDLRLLARVRRP